MSKETLDNKTNRLTVPLQGIGANPQVIGAGALEVLYIIKIGGNIIDDEVKLSSFLQSFAAIDAKIILIHGGGKLATKLAAQLGVEQQLIEGRRITDAETLKIVTMVYAGYINKNIVAQLQAYNCNAIGLCGADGNAILAHKRAPVNRSADKQNQLLNPPLGDSGATIDYGFVGDVDSVNTTLLQSLLQQNINVVLAPITHNKQGQLLNTNADTIAQEIAQAMSALYQVHLIYCFEKAGVLLNADDDDTVIPSITPSSYKELKEKQVIFAGMIPKLDNAFMAIDKGVHRVIIGKAEELRQLIEGKKGTSIIA
jgi:acetylglutamate kinase